LKTPSYGLNKWHVPWQHLNPLRADL